MGRTGQVGDELGSSLIANRVVRDIMRVIFLLEKQYYPYAKWFGTAFQRWTNYGAVFESILRQVQLAETWQEREQHLSTVYQQLAVITQEKLFQSKAEIRTEISPFHDRPFQA